MSIDKIDFSQANNSLKLDGTISKEIIHIDDEKILITIDPTSKIFGNNKLEAMRNIFSKDKRGKNDR